VAVRPDDCILIVTDDPGAAQAAPQTAATAETR